MQLTEKHRPASLAGIVGQSAVVESLRLWLSRGAHSSAFYLTGASGSGKTTTARALVAELKIDDRDVMQIGGADCLKESVQGVRENFALAAWGESNWKAVIIDEAHAMSVRAVQAWLPYLEELPARRLVLFTSTESLDCDLYGNFTGPLASRCKVYSLDADLDAFASHAATIAANENLNGQPLEAYRALIRRCDGNLRAALQKIEAGEMLKPYTAPAVSVAQAIVDKFARPAPPANSSEIPNGSKKPKANCTDINEIMEYFRKLGKGSKKYLATRERLSALGVKVQD